MAINSRISGRVGQIARLNMKFIHNSVLDDPFAIRRIDIYRDSVRLGNLVSQIVITDPASTSYPFPIIRNSIGDFEALFDVPDNFIPNHNYIDVWHFLPNESSTDIDDESLWLSQNGQFWVFDDVWIADDLLQTKKIGFEPLDKKLRRGEIRTIEIAIHPLPKYDYDYNKLAPAIAQLEPTMSVYTTCDELLDGLDDVPCKIGIRQGHHLNSPFVIQCQIDTTFILRGTYRYIIKVPMPDGSIIISDKYHFTVQ